MKTIIAGKGKLIAEKERLITCLEQTQNKQRNITNDDNEDANDHEKLYKDLKSDFERRKKEKDFYERS